jgi:hypothetical protein
MKKERKIPDRQRGAPALQKGSLKEHPFSVPEGYFETLPGKVMERIREEDEQQVPVRRITGTVRFRVAMAAAIVGLALISYSIIRTTLNGGSLGDYPDIALLEQLDIIDDDHYLVGFLDEESAAIDEEEAYVTQAIEFLAMADVEMDLIFE